MKHLKLLMMLSSVLLAISGCIESDENDLPQLYFDDSTDLSGDKRIRIWNGGGESGRFTCRIIIGNFITNEFTVETIYKKQYIDLTLSFKDHEGDLFTMILDVHDDVIESNEGDNIYQEFLSYGGAI